MEKEQSQTPISLIEPPKGYNELMEELKNRIHKSQQRASLSVNKELTLLYWQIGNDILLRQTKEGWGTKVIERLAHDLKKSFPSIKGFSSRNLKYMRQFAEGWPDIRIVQQVVAQLPWGHNLVLITKLKTLDERIAYAKKTIENSWSRNILTMQIETKLIEREGKAVTNFEHSLPKYQSDLAHESLKDPYCFDFLDLGNEAQEREIEKGLIESIFLVEKKVLFKL